ncbi:S8 family peptidase [Bacillus songklensis]|uniref:S8 family peptidase n=1 Tax=Bacillus songklensis TaxID=1069116 RepID=A0ABV8AWV6_9BACI
MNYNQKTGESDSTKVRLIPFQVESIKAQTNEIPSGVELIQAPSQWQQGFKGENVVVAVIDTGCQINHPDLQGQIIGGYNFTNDYDGDPHNFLDNNGHGTHVCGTIAARENNQGVVGAAPKAKLLILKVLTETGEGNIKDITSAIRYAIKWKGPNGERVRIISMSLGGPQDDPSLHHAVKEAVQQNILVVCAAGNEGDADSRTDEHSYPGAYPEVVEVGSVNLQERLSHFSDSNNQVDVVAPGEKIVSTYLMDQYAVLSGTSMATPHVSGALALLIEQYEQAFDRMLTEPEIYAQLIKKTVSLGYSKKDEGNGMIKLNSQTTVSTPPLPNLN